MKASASNMKQELLFSICALVSVLSIDMTEGKEEICVMEGLTNGGMRMMQVIDTKVSVCCMDRVIHKFDKWNNEINCCSNVTYNVKLEICCEGKLYPRIHNGYQQKCCGKIPYDEIKVCCSGKLYDYDSGKSCCGSQHVHNRGTRCCKDEDNGLYNVYNSTNNTDCCLSQLFNTNTHQCFRKTYVLLKGQEKCGNVTFDKKKHRCCENTLQPLDDNKDCCGDNLYNVTSQRCCNTARLPHIAPRNRQCCGNGFYDVNTQRCCESKVLDALPHQQCCGTNLRDPSTQECCGGKVIDKNISQCCRDGESAKVVPIQYQCCGSGHFNASREICCRPRYSRTFSIKKTKKKHDACCVHPSNQNLSRSYDRSVSACNKGHVTSLRKGQNSCGWQKFSLKKDLCCNRKLYKGKRREGFRCCHAGTGIYHKRTQICCDNVAFNKSQRKSCNSRQMSLSMNRTVRLYLKDKTYRICTACRWKERDFIKLLNDGTISPFDMNVVKLNVSTVKQARYKRKKLARTEVEGAIDRNIAYPRNKTMNGNNVTLQLPCSCKKLLRGREDLILLTHIKTIKGVIHLGDADFMMPFSPRLEQILKRKLKSFQIQQLQSLKEVLEKKIRQINTS